MEPERVAKIWIWYGLEDLFFGFCIEFGPHKPYALFSEIMGLEKILKGYLFFKNGNEYSSLDNSDAKTKIEAMAKKWGHGINKLLKEASAFLGQDCVDSIKQQYFDGYKGQDLIRAVETGYMESRYPTSRPFCEQFKINGTEIYRNPLKSSGITKFIYSVCQAILLNLKKEIDLSGLGKQFIDIYEAQQPSKRFISLAFDGDLNKYL